MSSTTRARTIAASLAAVLALGGLAACGSDSDELAPATRPPASGGVTVTDAWARESAMSSGDGAVYFTVTNGGDGRRRADRRVGARRPWPPMAQIHETVDATDDTMVGRDAPGSTEGSPCRARPRWPVTAMMTMQEVESVAVPAGGDRVASSPAATT